MANFVIEEDFDLQAFNTLALPARARYFVSITNGDALRQALVWARDKNLQVLTIGGGSNMILAGDWPGLVLHIALLGKTIEDENRVRIGAGENWHELVQWSLEQNLYGLENLTLIPGTAGAAPIQNIGAYGVELAERLISVRGIDIQRGYEHVLSAADCQLAYRDSIFKNSLRGRFVITEITLQLSREFTPVTNYPTLKQALALIATPTALDVERAVRQIRQSRLPDPAVLPNAGSFFKNPVVSLQQYEDLKYEYPTIPHFPAAEGVKIPAAWLVEQSGWKGRRVGAVGVHEHQPLVLIHYRDAGANPSGAEPSPTPHPNPALELLDLAAAIQSDVCQRFLIVLELEPTVYGG